MWWRTAKWMFKIDKPGFSRRPTTNPNGQMVISISLLYFTSLFGIRVSGKMSNSKISLKTVLKAASGCTILKNVKWCNQKRMTNPYPSTVYLSWLQIITSLYLVLHISWLTWFPRLNVIFRSIVFHYLYLISKVIM